MSTTIVYQIARDDGRERLTVHLRNYGLFFYTEDSFEAWDDTPAMWRQGYLSSGLFATADEARTEAAAVVSWLRASGN